MKKMRVLGYRDEMASTLTPGSWVMYKSTEEDQPFWLGKTISKKEWKNRLQRLGEVKCVQKEIAFCGKWRNKWETMLWILSRREISGLLRKEWTTMMSTEMKNDGVLEFYVQREETKQIQVNLMSDTT